MINIVTSARKARTAPPVGLDPWDARSLEWFTPNPTPAHNFDDDIQVSSLDEFWHRKYGEDENGKCRPGGHCRRGLSRRFSHRHPPTVTLVLAADPGRWPALRRASASSTRCGSACQELAS